MSEIVRDNAERLPGYFSGAARREQLHMDALESSAAQREQHPRGVIDVRQASLTVFRDRDRTA